MTDVLNPRGRVTRSGLLLSKKLSVPLELATDATAILGKRGSGKTNTAVVMVEEMVGAGIPVVVVDTVGVWWGLRSSADGEKPGLNVVVFGGAHGDVPLEEKSGPIIADAILDHGLSAVIDTSGLTKAAARRFLYAFITRLYERKAGDRTPLHVVFDEADELAPQRSTGEVAHLLGAMEDFVRRGRSRGLGVTLVTQRPAVLNKDVLTQVEVLIAMRMTGPTDVKAIDAWTSQHSDEIAAAKVKGSLAGLHTGTGWLWSPQFLDILELVPFRERRTFDSSATPKIGQARVEPKARTQVDLAKLGEQIAATVEKAKADDPRTLRATIAALEKQVAERPTETIVKTVPEIREVQVPVEVDVLTEDGRASIEALLGQLAHVSAVLGKALSGVASTPLRTPPPAKPVAVKPMTIAPRPVPQPVSSPEGEETVAKDLRAGARRMVESLGRMHPLRLTKAQWGTVSHMKTTSGTWSTYLGDIRRLGYIDESSSGFTLTEAGFDYLGGQPEPMSADELQDHYRTILRAGARRMLDAIIAAYPAGVGRDEIGETVEMATSSGTFSTYLGDLTRNGLIEKVGSEYRATDILMKGAA